jgi:hypothetical protein
MLTIVEIQKTIAGLTQETQAMRDFSRVATDQLKRSLRFHENDRGTMTADEEARRLYLVQEISAELTRRGVAS